MEPPLGGSNRSRRARRGVRRVGLGCRGQVGQRDGRAPTRHDRWRRQRQRAVARAGSVRRKPGGGLGRSSAGRGDDGLRRRCTRSRVEPGGGDRVGCARRRVALDAGVRQRRHQRARGDRSPDDDHQLCGAEGVGVGPGRRDRPGAARRVRCGRARPCRRPPAPAVRCRCPAARTRGLAGRAVPRLQFARPG